MIEYRKGNIIDAFDKGEITLLAHGVNCQGKFASGIAGQIAKRYPTVKDAYDFKSSKFTDGEWKLGYVQYITFMNGLEYVSFTDKPINPDSLDIKIIANCATQDRYGYNGKIYVDYDAIQNCMIGLLEFMAMQKVCPILGMPKIGAGLGGGDWNKIEEIINDTFKTLKVYVYEL